MSLIRILTLKITEVATIISKIKTNHQQITRIGKLRKLQTI